MNRITLVIPAKNEEEKETKTEWDVKTDPGWNLYDD